MAIKISRNRVFAAMAFLLGMFAIFGNPYRGSADIDAFDVTDIVWVENLDLAREIVEGRTDLRLLDLRGSEAYDQYHLPRAEMVKVDTLMDHDLETWQRVVVYGQEDDVAKSLAILESRQISGAMALRGGIEAWQSEILNPVLAEQSTPEQIEAFLALRGISLQLGGAPVGGEDLLANVDAKPRPKLELPSAASLPSRGKKKVSEGC